jgi:hypothetical protein
VGVSDRDRAYMERLGRYKAASHMDAQARHLALSLDERLRRSWALYEAHRGALPERNDDPSPFYERARALGLYTP